MIQDMINSDNMNSTESTIPNIFKMGDFITPFSRVLVALNISQLVPLGTGNEMEFKS